MNLDQTLIEDIENEEIDYRYEITSYGADYPVDSIVKRINDDIIYVPPFQRKFVWNQNAASKFIESLILGLPVPGVFLSKEKNTGKMIIVDGQQRLVSLNSFYRGIFKGKEFSLTGLGSNLNGRTYNSLDTSDKIRLDDSIIHATIIRQDEPDDAESSVYLIFERLNTGGNPLRPQEIRACIYYGEFNETLNLIVQSEDWRTVFGKENERLKEQELILRFFSLYAFKDSYTKPLKGFLNRFMSLNRNLDLISKTDLETIFANTIRPFAEVLGKTAFRLGGPLNAAVFDSAMIGLSERIKSSPISNDEFEEKYRALLDNPEYIENVRGATSDETIVNNRIRIAIEMFAN